MIETVLIAATRLLVGGHGRWQGCAPVERQRIYFANHTSHLDTILIWAALPAPIRRRTRPVAARDYWGSGALRRHVALDVLGAVLIDRGGVGEEALTPLDEALDAGDSLILFPEGTRGSDPLPGRFKSGLHRLAQRHPAAELVPVYLSNLSRAYPKGAILPAPLSCAVVFGEPVALAPDETRCAFLARARAAVCALSEGATR